ncbi:glutaredoxin family protein [Kangiella sp. TOML190]|uniref:glutaredoxin family protein n=1 Tax=Kangiella sp. TOML190 TaxID=2931351 RepID=UPI00203EF7AC|nr:glutaredoxin family protein [Kangiella sp. TOML190]
MQKIIFFTTFGCDLCENVERMFSQFFLDNVGQNKFKLEVFDIIDDELVMEQYRTKIPVLKNIETSQELVWPFSYSEFLNWLPS